MLLVGIQELQALNNQFVHCDCHANLQALQRRFHVRKYHINMMVAISLFAADHARLAAASKVMAAGAFTIWNT